jgi:glycosyltransferase involved in cell wall biosynthesis
MKKKVLIVATSQQTRGGITAVVNAYKKSSLWEKWNFLWIETHIDKKNIYKLVYLLKAFVKFLYNLTNSSLIHCHLSGPTSSLRKLPFLLLAKFFAKPIIVHFHAFSEKSNFDKKFKLLYYVVFKIADKIIVLSKNWRSSICESMNLPSDKIIVISNPCPKINQNLNLQKENIILYAGTLNKRKGYHDLINAFSKIDSKFSNWKLVFAGNGEIEEAKKLAVDFKIKDKVEFLGWVSNDDKNNIFQKSKIFCLPSYAEGFPMAVLDAWSYALPIISTPVGGIPDVAIHKENMMLFEPGNTFELQNAIEELIKNENLRKKLRNSSFKFSNDIFSIEKLAIKWDNLYENLIVK